MSFIKELQRRNVFKVAITYVVLAWLSAQVAELLLETFGSPDWVLKTLLMLLMIGFPFALFFAWAFELTPEGIKKEKDVDRSQSVTKQTGRKLDFMIIGVMAAALAYFAFDKLVLSTAWDAALIEATTQAMGEQITAEETSTESDNSIAVLPFVNMSDDASNEYFSDGISEEILNALAKVKGLQVTGRTSSFAFKGQDQDLREIGKALGVNHILKGSVRKSGNTVRITAQLIQVDNGFHLWSEAYDRELDDVFAIQDEIAAAVVAQLKIVLLGAPPVVQETDPRAYAFYLQGRHLRQQGTSAAFEQAETLLGQALAIEPDYAAALVELGNVYDSQLNTALRSIDEGLALKREVTNKALAIEPDNALALAQLGRIAFVYDRNLADAARYLEHALRLEPANPSIIRDAGNLMVSLGRLDEAIELAKILTSRDPVNPTVHTMLSHYYMAKGQWDKAIASYRTALVLSPGRAGVQVGISVALLHKGEAQTALEAMQLETSVWGQIGLPMAYHALGRNEESDAALEELIAQFEQEAAYNIAYVLAYRGEADQAFEWLAKAVEYQDAGLAGINNESLFTRIHDDPRWAPFLESIGRSPEQLAAIKFEVTLPN